MNPVIYVERYALGDRSEDLRRCCVHWLRWNDANGEYDADLPLAVAIAMLREAIATGAVAGNHERYMDAQGTFQEGDFVSHRAHPGVRFIVDTVKPTELGLTVARINGAAIWASPADVELVYRGTLYSDGANGWRPPAGAERGAS